MGEERVADLTVSELKGLIARIVDERLPNGQEPGPSKDSRTVEEILAAMDRLRIKPQPGKQTFSEMILEERELWRQGM